MPKDEWEKARQRDVQHKAAREFAAGEPRTFAPINPRVESCLAPLPKTCFADADETRKLP